MHPADRIRGAAGDRLEGRRIVLAISGSIAAVKCVELARELTRRGAEVRAVMSGAATSLVGEAAVGFATGSQVVTELTGDVEHVTLLGEDGWGDLLLLAPATANTLGKIAQGIDDTPITSAASVALGHLPIVACPAMHGTMHDNPAVRRNLETLAGFGVEIVQPAREEGKAKLAPIETICAAVERALGPRDLAGRSVLVVTGGTEEPVDDVRTLGNVASGRTGFAIAEAAHRRGADVEVWYGHGTVEVPDHLPVRRFGTIDDLLDLIDDAEPVDAAVVPAALADYVPKPRDGKIASGRKDVEIDLVPAARILPKLRPIADRLVGFKLESGVGDAELLERAEDRLKRYDLDAIVANRLEEVDEDRRAFILTPTDRQEVEAGLDGLADAILDRGVLGG